MGLGGLLCKLFRLPENVRSVNQTITQSQNGMRFVQNEISAERTLEKGLYPSLKLTPGFEFEV